MKITLSRALTELKLTEKQLDETVKIFNSGVDGKRVPLFVGFHQINQERVFGTIFTDVEFGKNAQKELDSFEGLIKKHTIIKRAISDANNTFKVTIGGAEMTITEAIFRKKMVEYKKALLARLVSEQRNFVINNKEIEDNIVASAKSLSEQMAGSNQKPDPEKIAETQKLLASTQKLVLIDPLKATDLIDKYKTEIDTFLKEIDYTLSEVNAKSEIVVEF